MRKMVSTIIHKRFYIDLPLDDFKNYSKTVEESFSIYQKEFQTEMETISEEDQEQYMDYWFDEYQDYIITYPSIHRKSLFISIYSFFEHKLTSLCKEIIEKKKIELKLNDITGSGIEKSQKFLKKVVKINFPDNTSEWKLIKDYNKIRNCIVHNNGIIDDYNKPGELKKIIENIYHIRYDEDSIIKINNGFCDEFISIISKFLHLLYDEVYTYLKQPN